MTQEWLRTATFSGAESEPIFGTSRDDGQYRS
jgi:hypothetical protein